jgi:hypothetical protein
MLAHVFWTNSYKATDQHFLVRGGSNDTNHDIGCMHSHHAPQHKSTIIGSLEQPGYSYGVCKSAHGIIWILNSCGACQQAQLAHTVADV